MADNYLDGAGPYLSLLNGAEDHYSIPRNLLVRIAFQECSWRPEVINGTEISSAGCVGMMQLNPKDFPHAGRSIPNDVATAAELLSHCDQRFNDWQLAVAAYNWGEGNVHRWIASGQAFSDMPAETQNYVRQVFADVPLTGSLIPIAQGVPA